MGAFTTQGGQQPPLSMPPLAVGEELLAVVDEYGQEVGKEMIDQSFFLVLVK